MEQTLGDELREIDVVAVDESENDGEPVIDLELKLDAL